MNKIISRRGMRQASLDEVVDELLHVLPAHLRLLAQSQPLRAQLPPVAQAQVLRHLHETGNEPLHPAEGLLVFPQLARELQHLQLKLLYLLLKQCNLQCPLALDSASFFHFRGVNLTDSSFGASPLLLAELFDRSRAAKDTGFNPHLTLALQLPSHLLYLSILLLVHFLELLHFFLQDEDEAVRVSPVLGLDG